MKITFFFFLNLQMKIYTILNPCSKNLKIKKMNRSKTAKTIKISLKICKQNKFYCKKKIVKI